MTRARFRVVYVTLIAAFALPLALNLLTNTMGSPKQLRPYFAVATALMLAALVSNELRENRANNPEMKLGLVADRLAQSINEQWIVEAGNRKINEPTRLPVPWMVIQDRPFDSWSEVVDLAQQQPSGQHLEAACSAGTLDNDDGLSSIGSLFARIPTHRLVVLGPPGGGKTVLLVELVLQLLQQQNREVNWSDRPRSDKVVPVLFSLSSWNPSHKLRDWLVERLVTEHPALQAPEHGGEGASSQAQALVRQNLVLPVLDGFDEIPPSMRVTALEKISEALREQMGIVISSRYEEFQRAAEAASTQTSVTPGAVAVCLGDVTASSAMHYLDRLGSQRWDKVFARLDNASPVGRVLRTPLMISLAHTIYNWRPPGDVSTPLPSPDELVTYDSDDELQSHLFDAFVLAAYRDRPGDAGTVLRWLKYLAAYLECGQRHPRRYRRAAECGPDDGTARATMERKPVTTDFAWWRLRASVPFPLTGLILGLPPAAAVGLVAAVTPGLGIGLGLGIMTGLTVGAIIKFIGSGRRRLPEKPGSIGFGIAGGFIGALLGAAPTGVILELTGQATPPMPPGLMGALGAGIGVGVCYGPRRGVVSAAAGGAVVALTAGAGTGVPAGIIDGLGAWIVAALTVETIGLRSPSRGIRGMRWSKVGCLTGAAAGISIGTAVALTSSPRAGLMAGLVAASVGGFAAGLEGIPAGLAEAAAGPAELLARDRGTCWLVAVIGGTAFGLGAGLGVRLPVGLAAGLTVGLIAASIQASWLPFSLARLWFAGTGRLPLRLISLLRDAHKRSILRQEGGIYQFRHVELQRRLATQDHTNYQAPRQNMLATPAARTHS
jgi:hypothetical protein